MPSGFDNWKDILDVVVVPITIGLLALLWPVIQSYYRCRRFRLLALRELVELSPFPKERSHPDWTQHVTKAMLHKKILDAVSDNRDFLLGLNPDFLYYISQLWTSYDNKDSGEWLIFLNYLSEHRYSASRKDAISKVAAQWEHLIKSYPKKGEALPAALTACENAVEAPEFIAEPPR